VHTLILLAATPSPSPTIPSLRAGLSDDQVGPGFLGFLAMAFIATLVFFLIRDMAKRIRRVRYRAMVEEGAAGGSHGPDAEFLAIPIVADDAARSEGAPGTDTSDAQAPDVPTPGTNGQQG
jgi:hypothetical protein